MADPLRELEAALVTSFSLDNLQVYGDYLMSIGDPRGELIAVDVHTARHGRTPDVEHRRRRAIRTWLELPSHVDPTKGGWEMVRFAFGFVEDVRIEYASRILASRAGPFVRGITLTNKSAGIEQVLAELASAPRPWLQRLTIAPRFKGQPPAEVWRADPPNLSFTRVPALIAATPRLERLELAGHRLFREFPHPSVRRLRIEGIDAFQPVLEKRAAMPAVTELSLAFARAPGEPVLLQRPWPDLLPATCFPALHRLDLSANENQRSTTDTQVGVFDVLPRLGVLARLVELRLPSIRNAHEAAVVRKLLPKMPLLKRIEIVRLPTESGRSKHTIDDPRVEIVDVAVPWPRYESPLASSQLWLQFAADREVTMVRVREAIRFCERFDEFDAEAQSAWVALWEAIHALDRVESPPQSVPGWQLRLALDAVGFIDASREELRGWARLRDRAAGFWNVFVARDVRRLPGG